MTELNAAGWTARSWAAAIAVVALVYMVASAVMGVMAPGPGLLATLLVAGLAFAISRGLRWARTVLVVITAIQAINLLTDPGVGVGMVFRVSYVAAMAFCLWGLYRPPAAVHFSRPEAFVTRSPSLRRAAWFAVLLGSAASFVGSFALALWVIARLEQQYGVRADFGTNGLNWISAGAGLVGMLFPLYLLLALFVFVPYLAKHPIGQQLKVGHILAGILLPEVVLAGLAASAGSVVERTAGVVWLGPPIVATAGAGYWYLKRWKSDTDSRTPAS